MLEKDCGKVSQCIRRVREECKVGKLVPDLEVVTGLCLAVTHGILLHSHIFQLLLFAFLFQRSLFSFSWIYSQEPVRVLDAISPAISVSMAGVNSISSLLSDEFSN